MFTRIRYQNTVFDQRHLFGSHQAPYGDSAVLSYEQKANFMKNFRPGASSFICKGSGHDCFVVGTIADSDHCSMGCTASSNWTLVQQFNLEQYALKDLYPLTYMLSQCGETIGVNAAPDVDQENDLIRVFSHKGLGCQWYSKDGEDHECSVTFVTQANATMNYDTMAPFVDGNATTGEGDTIEIYNGASIEGDPLFIINANGRSQQ